MRLIQGDGYCGSRLYIDQNVFKNEIANLVARTKSIITDGRKPIHERHNAYTDYTITLMNYSSGHRPVTDPMAFREDVDLDSGLVMINDKASSPLTERRVVVISDGSVQTFEEYMNHLSGLAGMLSENDQTRALANTIANLTNPVRSKTQAIPLFFYLNEKNKVRRITNSCMSKAFGQEWRYELNGNRHFLESQLHENGVPVPFIDYHLGHQNGFTHPLGTSSGLTHFEYSSCLKPILNQLHDEYEWKVLKGFPSNGYEAGNKTLSRGDRCYGHIHRKKNREQVIKYLDIQAREFVLQKIMVHGVDRIIKKERLQSVLINQFFSSVKIASKYKQKSIGALRREILKEAKNAGKDVGVIFSAVSQEVSPLKERWLNEYSIGNSLRQTFIEKLGTNELTLNNHKSKKISLEGRWAIVVVSAIIVGGVVNHEWINYLVKSGPSVLRKMMHWILYADIWLKDNRKEKIKISERSYHSPDYRWIPDSFTKALILKMSEEYPDFYTMSFSENQCKKYSNKILEQIGVIINPNQDALKILSKKMTTYWSRYYPQYINNIFSGKYKTDPLSEHSLARLCYQRRYRCEIKKTVNLGSEKYNLYAKKDRIKAIDYHYLLIDKLNGVNIKNQSKPAVQLKELRNEILLLHRENDFPEVCHALSQWVIYITENGTPRRKTPPISTVMRYFKSISRPLCLLVGDDKFFDAEDERLSELYKLVVEFNKSDSVIRYRSQVYFNYVINELGLMEVGSLNWKSIGAILKDIDVPCPDTNIVTNEEVSNCLNAVLKSTNSRYFKYTISAAIVICYRFGLRVSELIRLRLQDIQFGRTGVILQVAGTKFGKTKSRAGVRQIPQVVPIPDNELSILKSQWLIAKEFADGNLKSLIFFNDEKPGELIDLVGLRVDLFLVLRHIIGDPRIKIHHLRHSFITNLFQQLESENGLHIYDVINRFEISGSIKNIVDSQNGNLNNLPLFSGHASLMTSLHSYVHLVHDVITGYVEQVDIDIDIAGVSQIRGQEVQTIRNRINKNKLNSTGYPAHEVLRSMRPTDKFKKVAFIPEKYPVRLPIQPKERKVDLVSIDRVLTLYGIKTHQIESIAHYTGYSDSTIHSIVNAAKRLSETMCVNFYGDLLREPNNFWLSELAENYNRAVKGRKYFRLIQRRIDEILDIEKNKLKLWMGVVKGLAAIMKNENGLAFRFRSPIDLDYFYKGLELLGYDKNDLTFGYSEELSEKSEKEIKDKIMELGFENIKSKKLRRLESGFKEERYGFLDISMTKIKEPDHLRANSVILISNTLFLIGVKMELNRITK